MKEIRWHGRGGHGSFTAAILLGLAACKNGNYAQAFPSFGPERRGAPVLGFTRIADGPIHDHSQVYSCDCIAVLDETLIDSVDVAKGLKDNGIMIINSTKAPQDFNLRANVLTLDATTIAMETLGAPIANTVMLGAVAGATGFVGLQNVCDAIDEFLPAEIRAQNKKAAGIAFETVAGGKP